MAIVDEFSSSRASVPHGEATAHIPVVRRSFTARYKGPGGSAERWRTDGMDGGGSSAHAPGYGRTFYATRGAEDIKSEGKGSGNGFAYVRPGDYASERERPWLPLYRPARGRLRALGWTTEGEDTGESYPGFSSTTPLESRARNGGG